MATAPAEATPPRLRLATAADAAVIARLINQAFAGYRDWLKPPPSALNETPESIARLLAAQQGAVAEIDDRPAGCALFRPQGRDVYLGRLSVLPADQGKGIARALIDFVETRAQASGAEGLVVEVRIALPDNQRLFTAAGFREVARHAHPGFDHPTFIEMRKPLAD